MTILNEIIGDLTCPSEIYSQEEVCSRTNPVPNRAGVYAWFFKQIPSQVSVDNCIELNGLTLLYIGISPARPNSANNIRNRLRAHYNSNASASTLRLTLGCLLSDKLNIQLRRTGRTQRFTFGPGEEKLSEWLSKNGFVTWYICDQPWIYEIDVIRSVSLPLNIGHNEQHPFCDRLRESRLNAYQTARSLPVIP